MNTPTSSASPSPMLTIPVKPGRNLAIIIEVAAMNNRQKKMGYNAAQELMHNLGMDDQVPPPRGPDRMGTILTAKETRA